MNVSPANLRISEPCVAMRGLFSPLIRFIIVVFEHRMHGQLQGGPEVSFYKRACMVERMSLATYLNRLIALSGVSLLMQG